MKNIKLDIKSYTENLGGSDPEDDWSRDSTSTSVYIGSKFEISNKWSDISSDIEFEKDKDYYLVWVSYSTGDSFGHDSGQYELIEIYDSLDKAEATEKVIYDNYKVYENVRNVLKADYTVELPMNNGNIVKLSCPWKGYFESLENVNIDTIRLK